MIQRKGRHRFFFDHGAGGCLWAGDERTTKEFGSGPVDAGIYDLNGQLKIQPSLLLLPKTQRLIEELDQEHSEYLNPNYQMDPSLWRQERCNRFNKKVDELLTALELELGKKYNIIDQQERYSEDPDLDEYLKDPKSFNRT